MSELLGLLKNKQKWDNVFSLWSAPKLVYLGIADGNYGGIASRTAPVAASSTRGPGDIITFTAHELGHLFGREHVPYSDEGEPFPAGPYDKYDLPLNSISPTVALSPRFGIDFLTVDSFHDLTSNSIKHPVGHADLMSYCKTCWISAQTYDSVLNVIHNQFNQAGRVGRDSQGPGIASEYAMISGIVDPVLSTATLHPISRVLQAITKWRGNSLSACPSPLSTMGHWPGFGAAQQCELVRKGQAWSSR